MESYFEIYAFTLATGLIAAVIAWYYVYLSRALRMKGPIKWTLWQWPIAGIALKLRTSADNVEMHLKVFEKMQADTLFLMAGFQPTMLTKDPNVIRAVVGNKTVVLPRLLQIGRALAGRGLFLSEGIQWKMQRKLLAPLFYHNKTLEGLKHINANGNLLVEVLKDEVHKDSTDMLKSFENCFGRIVFEGMLGAPFDSLGDDLISYIADTKAHLVTSFRRLFKPEHYLQCLYKLTEEFRFEQNAVHFREFVFNKFINGSRKRNSETKSDGGSANNNVILDELLQYRDSKNLYDDHQLLLDDMHNVTAASVFTVSTTLAYATHLLAEHPEVQDKVYKEVQSIYQKRNGEDITESDIAEMTYLHAVLKETLRLYAPVPVITRELTEDIEYEGGILPRGLVVIVLSAALHMNTKYYERPEEFLPERFLDRVDISPYMYMPFGGGSRLCIGVKYSYILMKVVLSKLLMNYELISVNHRVMPLARPVSWSATGYRVHLKRRPAM